MRGGLLGLLRGSQQPEADILPARPWTRPNLLRLTARVAFSIHSNSPTQQHPHKAQRTEVVRNLTDHSPGLAQSLVEGGDAALAMDDFTF